MPFSGPPTPTDLPAPVLHARRFRPQGLLVSSPSAVEEDAERLRTKLETSGVRTAYRSGYERGHMDAAKQMARREDVDYLTARSTSAYGPTAVVIYGKQVVNGLMANGSNGSPSMAALV